MKLNKKKGNALFYLKNHKQVGQCELLLVGVFGRTLSEELRMARVFCANQYMCSIITFFEQRVRIWSVWNLRFGNLF